MQQGGHWGLSAASRDRLEDPKAQILAGRSGSTDALHVRWGELTQKASAAGHIQHVSAARVQEPHTGFTR